MISTHGKLTCPECGEPLTILRTLSTEMLEQLVGELTIVEEQARTMRQDIEEELRDRNRPAWRGLLNE